MARHSILLLFQYLLPIRHACNGMKILLSSIAKGRASCPGVKQRRFFKAVSQVGKIQDIPDDIWAFFCSYLRGLLWKADLVVTLKVVNVKVLSHFQEGGMANV